MPAAATKKKRCVFLVGGRRCNRKADPGSNPPLCEEHLGKTNRDEKIQMLQGILGIALQDPQVARVVSRVGAIVDQVGTYADDPVAAVRDWRAKQAKPKKNNARRDALLTLGFDPEENPDQQAIKARQRALASALHPDKGTGDPEAMRRINAAVEILTQAQ